MALTKVTGQVINTSTDVTVGVLTVTNTLAVGGTVSIGGTLTYEDVTNIDSVGLITARNGIVVGSGITLSKDGDVFATGITTVSGNVKVGTGITLSPDGDGFFTGVITATSYSGIDLSNVTGAQGDFSIVDKIVHTGDTDTAIRFSGADTITAETAGGERLRIDSTGSLSAGGTPLTESDLNWSHDTYQRPHIFSGITGGTPSDGAIVVATVTENPSDSRIGAFIFGCKTSSTSGVSNSGLKAFIEGCTNTNVSDAWKTGGYMKFSTRADNGSSPVERLRITSGGDFGFNTSTIRENIHTHQADSSENYLRFTNTGTGTGTGDGFNIGITASEEPIVWNFENTNMLFATNNTERFRITSDGHVFPAANDTYDLGSSSLRWRDIYTGDLNLSNKGKTNDVDGSWGDYTIQEGESDLFLINNRSGKKFKFNLTEVS